MLRIYLMGVLVLAVLLSVGAFTVHRVAGKDFPKVHRIVMLSLTSWAGAVAYVILFGLSFIRELQKDNGRK